MEAAARGTLRAIAGQLAVIVGVVHLGMGTYYAVGISGAAVAGDPRVVLWALAGAGLVGGVALAAVGWHRPRLHAVGLVVTLSLVGAHFAWPILVGGNFYLGPGPRASLSDPAGYVYGQVMLVRPLAKVVLATELALVTLLVVLLSYDEAY